ncbi:MAG: serine/threonine protein kinase [Myxococcales bacterium]|nr:serine/threonine protein kinase [Myxococcales bacterium]
MTIPAGTLVPRDARDFGSYQLIAKLATGGMAEIYLARPSSAPTSKDVLVLKRILPHLAEDDHFVTMFRDEADLASKLVHKNVCNVQSFGQYGGTWFIAMEYLHGVPLSRMMTKLSKAGKMLDYRIVAAIICQACEGLHAAHEARGAEGELLGVVHRDVSPPNMMVISDGTVKLLDFGIAKARGANSRTRTGTVKGKNAYMSPEQILGKPLDRRSDIFALGCVMYEMLAIRRLFHRDSDFLTFKAITEEPIPDIRERRPDLPPGMRAALIQAMARDPNGRFDTAQQFGNAIRNSVSTLGGPAAQQDLARLLFTDFSDEMAARDEILKAADDPNAAPLTVGIAKPATPPPIPVRPAKAPTQAGEVHQPTPARAKQVTGSMGAQGVPSVMVAQPTGRMQVPDLENVPDLSAAIMPDTWMEDPGTNLLSAHRWKSLRNTAIALGLAVVAAVAIFFIVNRMHDETPTRIAAAPKLDAGVKIDAYEAPLDANGDISHDDIYALSKYGFFSINASAKTSIYVDGKLIGETPLTRLPLQPGPHTVKASGPHGKSKQLKITILGGRDTDEGMITW